MNKTKIEWCDYNWNPVTGCLHDCEYCYAKRIAKRFGTPYSGTDCHEVSGKVKSHEDAVRTGLYPYGFAPTFYRYRLNEPKAKTKGIKIFVCSMADLFGEWVPRKWIEEILETVNQCPRHTFIFLTKNPKGMQGIEFPNNCWCGVSIENQEKADLRIPELLQVDCRIKFVSYEPALGPVALRKKAKNDMEIIQATLMGVLDDYSRPVEQGIDWIIIGAQTGPGAVKPEPQWINGVADQAKAAGVPVFIKDNAADYYGGELLPRQFPEEVQV